MSKLTIISPVLQVDVPSFSGAFGILPNHVPTLAVLKPGVVTVYEEDGATNKFFVSSGSVSINEDASVQILAEEVHKVADIDAAAAKDLVAKASAKVAAAVDEVCNILPFILCDGDVIIMNLVFIAGCKGRSTD